MQFREKRQDELGLDLTPFIDVVFMLLLFFVVSTSLFKGATQLGVQLPKAQVQTYTKEGNTLEIGVDASGAYYLNGQSLGSQDAKKLKRMLAAKLENNKSLAIVVAGDKKAPHQAVVSVLEVASQLGITKVQIIAQK